MSQRKGRGWRWASGLWIGAVAIALCQPSYGRPVPDATLGSEGSQVIDRSPVDFDVEGGARRGANLFHSFQELGVDDGGSVYFLNPTGIENIFSRVTGANRSDILGTLGVRGGANLFLMNPNGILFGPNASLDVQGSFVGTTANAIGFGEGGFSATNPQAVPSDLLRVSPSAFLFNQIPLGNISNSSVAPAGLTPRGFEAFGLRVPNGQSLVLVGGDISMDGGRLNAFGGRIELGGLAAPGTVRLETVGNRFRLGFPTDGVLSNLTLANDARVAVRANGGGDITVNSNRFTATDGSRLVSGIESTGSSGDITVTANDFNVSGVGRSGLRAGLFIQIIPGASGSLGDISVNTQSFKASSDAALGSEVLQGGNGNSGNIIINASDLSLTDGGQISASILGRGNAGNVSIRASNSIILDGMNSSRTSPSGVFSTLEGISGRGGNIRVSARSLSFTNGAQFVTRTFGQGDAGSIFIHAGDSISFSDRVPGFTGDGQPDMFSSGLLSDNRGGQGNAGGIDISANSIAVYRGAQITSITFGRGDASNITINARDRLLLGGTSANGLSASGAFSEVGRAGIGNGANIEITTRLLSITNGAVLSTRSFERGNAGNITVNASDSVSLDNGYILSTVTQTGVGEGGNINVGTRTLALANGAQLATSTFGQGNAGSLNLQTRQLSVQNGAGISASTIGSSGRAGDIIINADSVELGGVSTDRSLVSIIGSQSEINPATNAAATGDAGNVIVTTRTLNLQDGARISTGTVGQGRGGNLTVRATESAELSGIATLANGDFRSSLTTGTFGSGRAGSLRVEAGDLRLLNGGQIIASTVSSGRAGNIQVEADSILLDGRSSNQPDRQQVSSGIGSETFSQDRKAGDAGNIRIITGALDIRDQAVISTATSGQGNAGNITVENSGDTTLVNDANITSSIRAGAVGNGGRIILRTRSLLVDSGQIAATVSRQSGTQDNFRAGGRGRGGDILIRATDDISLTGTTRNGFSGGILTLSERGAEGDAGNITIFADDFRVADGAIVVASTFNQGNGGDIEINANNFEALNGGQVVTNTRAQGQAGTIEFNIANDTNISGFDRNFQNRRARAREYTELPNVTDRISDVIVNQGGASGLFANTSRDGQGGTINVQTQALTLSDGATVSTTSQRSGQAGSISITASNRLQAEGGRITTNANQSAGGDIQLTGGDIDLSTGSRIRTDVDRGTGDGGNITVNADAVRLQDNSDIQTRVGETGEGDGGDITVTADSIIAFDDSDIITEARNQGGDIDLNTPVFLGAGYQEDSSTEGNSNGNDRVDLDASGDVSAGTVQTPDTSFIQNSLSDLPDDAVDADSLIANSCIARTENGGTFLVTGSGGLPPRPGTAPLSPYPAGTVRTEVDEVQASTSNWRPGDAIVEPQGVYRLPDGQLVMSRECR